MTDTVPARPAAPARTGRLDWSTWPRYEAATTGFAEYWYPVAWSRKIGKKPIQVQVLGQKIMLKREGGTVRALHDRCPHRGVPLSHPSGSQEFTGTWSCGYHGWTFDLETGVLVAAVTDGPDSPICGKVAVRTYPVEERRGLVWLWLGEGPARPLTDDVPEELLRPEAIVLGRITVRDGNWRFGAENGFDDGHAKWLHRNALWTLRVKMPIWSRMKVIRDGPWITRRKDEMYYQAEFPGLGTLPKKKWYKRREGNKTKVSLRLPGTLRVKYETWSHFEWWVPITAENHLYVQLATMNRGRWNNLKFWLYYRLWARWVFHGMFNDEDRLMVEVTDAPPERLYRPDVSLTEWRKLCEQEARRGPAEVSARRGRSGRGDE